jgi:hypothetical protein
MTLAGDISHIGWKAIDRGVAITASGSQDSFVYLPSLARSDLPVYARLIFHLTRSCLSRLDVPHLDAKSIASFVPSLALKSVLSVGPTSHKNLPPYSVLKKSHLKRQRAVQVQPLYLSTAILTFCSIPKLSDAGNRAVGQFLRCVIPMSKKEI